MITINDKVLMYYQNLHQTRVNLVIHIIGSVLFIGGNLSLVYFLVTTDLNSSLISIGLIFFSILLQAIGHQFEPVKFEGFKGPFDFVKTFYLELVIVFPVFLFSKFFRENWNQKVI